ncbi:hypothetical protein Tco_0381810 [Tanacetum coccineum]
MADSSSQEQIPPQQEKIPQQQDQPDRLGTPIPLDPAPHDLPLLPICWLFAMPVEFKAPNTSSYNRKKVSKGKNPRATVGHRRKQTSSTIRHNAGSKIEATKGGPSIKETTGSKTGHSKKKKSISAKDINPIKPPASTPLVDGLHKEDQQATGIPTSLGVTSEDRANPQLSSVKSASIHAELVYSASTIIHFEFASGHDALAAFTAKADPRKTDHNDSVYKQQGIVKGTNIFSFDYIIAGTNPHVLVDKTTSASEGLETILTKPATKKEANKAEKEFSFRDDEFNTSLDVSSCADAKNKIKMEDLSKLVHNVEVDFMELYLPEYDQPIIIQDEDKE